MAAHRITLAVKALIARYLTLFSEVRSLRAIHSRQDTILRELHTEIHALKQQLTSASHKHGQLTNELEEYKEGLRVMTEARLNADRTAEAHHSALAILKDAHLAEVANLQRVIDCFSLNACGRQVFGTAPAPPSQPDELSNQRPMHVQGRHIVQQATADAVRRAQEERDALLAEAVAHFNNLRTGTIPDDAGTPDYSSTARAI